MDSNHLPNSLSSTGDHSTNIIELNKKRKLPCYELENSDSPLPKHRICDRYDTDHPQIITNDNSMEAELIDSGIDTSLEIESENDSNCFIGVSDNKITSEAGSNVENPSMSSSQDKLCAEDQFEDEAIEDVMIYSNDVAPFLLASGKCSVEQGINTSMASNFPIFFVGILFLLIVVTECISYASAHGLSLNFVPLPQTLIVVSRIFGILWRMLYRICTWRKERAMPTISRILMLISLISVSAFTTAMLCVTLSSLSMLDWARVYPPLIKSSSSTFLPSCFREKYMCPCNYEILVSNQGEYCCCAINNIAFPLDLVKFCDF